jgi:hypothetical protein
MLTIAARSQEKLMPVEYTNAITKIAPISSMTAKASRKERNDAATLGPSIVNKPTAKAISVATGTPHPAGATEPAIAR